MPIAVLCRSCGHKLNAPDGLAGRRASCPVCQQPVAVPFLVEEGESQAAAHSADAEAPHAPPPPFDGDAADLPFACPFCEEEYSVAAELAGRQVLCRNCRSPSHVAPRESPDPDAQPEPQPAGGRRRTMRLLAAGGVAVLAIAAFLSFLALYPKKAEPVAVVRPRPDLLAERERSAWEGQAARERAEVVRRAESAMEAERRRLEAARLDFENRQRELERERALERTRQERERVRGERLAQLQAEERRRQQEEERRRREAEERRSAEEKHKAAARGLMAHRNRLESVGDVAGYSAFEIAKVRLDWLHTKYVKRMMTKSVVSEFTKSLRDSEVLRQVKYIAEVEGDWVPGLVAPDYRVVPISEVWRTYKSMLKEMIERGEGGFDFQPP